MTAFVRAFLLAGLVAALPAQVTARTTGTIQGVVTDPAGAVIPGVRIQLEGPAARRSVVSDGEGAYRAVALPPGTYAVGVTHAPFQHRQIDAIDVAINRTVTIDIRLELA